MNRKSRHVLLVSQYFDPESFKGNDIAVELQKRGYQVDVLTSIPNYPNGVFFQGYGFFKKRIEKRPDGIKVYRCFTIPRGKKSRYWMVGLGYIAYFIFGSIWAFLLSLFKKYDCVFVQQLSPAFGAAPGMVVAKMQNIPLYTWVLDLWPSTIEYHIKGLPLKLTNSFCRRMYRQSSKVLISSEGFRQYIMDFAGIKSDDIILFPNWSLPVLGQPLKEIGSLPIGFKILMAGNLSTTQIFDSIYSLMLRFKGDKRVQWVFLGNGSERENLLKFIAEHEMEETITAIERVPFEYIPAYYNAVDAMFLALKGSKPHLHMTIPARFQSYLAAGKPVISMTGYGVKDLVKEIDCGYSFDSDDIDGAYNAILDILNNPIAFAAKGEHGYKYFLDHYTLEKCIDNLESIISQN